MKGKKIVKSKVSLKGLSKKISYKKAPSNKMSVTIKDYKAENIFDDPNRFFKSEWEETKRSLFFRWYSLVNVIFQGGVLNE